MNTRTFALLTSLVAAWFCTSAQANFDSPEAVDRGEVETSAPRLDREGAGGGPAVTAFLNGRDYLEDGNYPKAVESFSAIIALAPALPLTYVMRGDAFLLWRKPHEAIADYDKAEQLGGLSPQTMVRVHVQRARCRIGLRENEAAVRDLDAALVIAPETVSALYWRAVARARLGQLPAALADYDALFRLTSLSGTAAAETHAARADVLIRLKEYARAVADLTKALSIQPQHLAYMRSLGYAYEKQAMREQALEIYREAARLHPSDEWTKRQLARMNQQAR